MSKKIKMFGQSGRSVEEVGFGAMCGDPLTVW